MTDPNHVEGINTNQVYDVPPEAQTSGTMSLETAVPVSGRFNLSEASLVPGQDKITLDNAQRIGVAFDKMPVLNVQNVGYNDRLLTQLLFDTPEEKVDYLKKYMGDGYEFAQHPRIPTDVIVKKKGAKNWGVVDPGGLTADELLPELMENIDGISQMASIPAGVLAGAATTGGIQAVRQALRQALMPGEVDVQTGKVLIDAAAGAFGGGVNGIITSAAKKGGQQVISKTGEILETAGEKIAQSADGGILSKVGQKLDIVNTPKFIAKEMGASGKQLDPTNPNLLINKVAKLQKNHPEFMEAYKGAWTLKGKFKNLAQLSDDAGEAIATQMNELGQTEVALKDIIKSKAFTELDQAANTRFVKEGKNVVKVDRATKVKIQQVRKNFLEDLGSMVLGEGDKSSNSIMNLYRKGKLVNEDIAKELGAKTNDEALIALIGDQKIALGDAWALRLGRDQIIKYGKQQGQITAKNTADKYTADAVRQAMQGAVKDLPGGADLLKNQDLYSQLYPVLKTMGAKLGAADAAVWNPLKTLPGMINSAPRFAAKLGVNLANKVEVRAFMEGLAAGKFPLPPDAMISAPKGGTELIGQLMRGTKFNFAKGMLNKNAEAEALPRNVESYFQNPEYINRIGEQVDDPELVDSMVRMFERGDTENFSNVLSMVSSENETAFDSAPYKSLVMNQGKPVIMDKFDREEYRKYLEKNIIDPRDRYVAMQALNGGNVMTIKPFEPPEAQLIRQQKQPKTSAAPQGQTTAVSRVASQLKKADTVEIEDGVERRDYDY